MRSEDLPLGAHHSIAGGAPRAVERALATGCRVLQIFVKNTSQGRPIEDAEVRAFRRAARGAGLAPLLAHTSYLINLASPRAALRRRSAEALLEELSRCHRLGIPDLVLHPGSHGGEGESAGVGRVARALDEVLARTAETRVRILLETPKDATLDSDRRNLAVLRRLATGRGGRRHPRRGTSGLALAR